MVVFWGRGVPEGIDEGLTPTEALQTYLYEFKKSSGITSDAVLRQQVKDMFTKPQWTSEVINGKTIGTIKGELDILFAQKSDGIYTNLLEFISDSPAFKVIQ